ncbi:ABC transporter permease [uncultured Sneathiella sp.]|jgi:putative hydroxymethylpyrimidine transport system permease protein|uniref:ABC transporter permease n=1 Tax=uncultured Sneathiella sp. TaxID=879315 RepID=UPI0030DA63F7|tara:strand:+ start:40161 stop:40955 length:795 start_codon:yes stop_codon:yes gene_type:complete
MKIFRILITIAGLFLLWGAIAALLDLPKFILPSPLIVMEALLNHAGLIAENALTTASEILLGLVLGVMFGMISALMISAYQPVKQWVFPLLIASQAIPVFAIAPLLVLWLGYGIAPKVVMSLLIIYFPVTVGFLDGLNRTEPAWLNLAALLQQSGRKGRLGNLIRLYRYIKIPYALPSLASGIRVAAAIAPIGAVVGEWVGASSGLGYLMLHANARVQTDLMFASLLVLTLMALLLYYLIDHSLRRALPWLSDQDDTAPQKRSL